MDIPTPSQTFKQTLISIGIGFTISILTVIFQFTIDWLKHIPAEAPGAVVGMTHYIYSWKTTLT